MAADRGYIPLVTKERIATLHQDDPRRWTAEALAAEFQHPLENVRGVLELAEIERQRRAQVGEEKWKNMVEDVHRLWLEMEGLPDEPLPPPPPSPSRAARRDKALREDASREHHDAAADAADDDDAPGKAFRSRKRPRFVTYRPYEGESAEEAEERAVVEALGGKTALRVMEDRAEHELLRAAGAPAAQRHAQQQEEEKETEEQFAQGDALPAWCDAHSVVPTRVPFIFTELDATVPVKERRRRSVAVVRETSGRARAPNVHERETVLKALGYGKREVQQRRRRVELVFRRDAPAPREQ